VSAVFAAIDDALVLALAELVGGDAAPAEDVGSADALDLVAVIGFGGPRVKGCLGIAASSSAVRAIHPLGPEVAASRRASEDWLAELSNQLLGRAKRRLLAHGIEVTLSTPIVLRGMHIRVARPHSDTARCYRATTPTEPMVVWIDITALELPEPAPPPEESAAPGDSFFF
jgi:CheY-specific phosphatase CheX